MSTAKIYAPLLLVEAYLLFGLWLFFFGPIYWPLENQAEFLGFIFLYHVFFITGYMLQSSFFTKKQGLEPTLKYTSTDDNIFLRHFWLILFLAFATNIILHRNTTLSNSYIPDNFFSNLYRGLVLPWEARAFYASEASTIGFVRNPYITAITLFTGPFKYMLLPGLVFYWHALSNTQKIAGMLVLTIPLLTGVIASLSVINFSYVFIITTCLGVLVASNKSQGVISTIKQRKFFLAFLAFMLLFSFWQFYSVKSAHSPYQVIIENSKPQSINYLKQKGIAFKSEDPGAEKSNIIDIYEKLTSYMVQGYYGMSISLDEDFQSSYGIGHSVFLQKTFAQHLGIDVRDKTFPHKITEKWDEFVYWHSFYTYIANDVGFWGVAVIMLILGAYFSYVYLSAVLQDNFYAKMLLPLFGILFLYIPANNQIFGFLESMSSFWILTLLFILSKKARVSGYAEGKNT
ncbi:hypothetical protein [Pseudomonas sp. MPR-LB3]|uniref:hypothetical protein n=2 Tax=Pseudomonas sp. MPR-LB3 TaxID=2070625 RepID=UPI001A91B36A|nr:hypothetical protein [Pseudomonas sp. MPR-LB3]